jgi:hypothetical protein
MKKIIFLFVSIFLIACETVVVEKNETSDEPEGPHTSNEWKIWAYSTAAPSFIADECTVVDMDGTILREGSNGWTAMAANPRGPANPENGWKDPHEAMPMVGDAASFAWVSAYMAEVLGYQTRVLSHLLYPNTLQRILDSQQYGNLYSLTEFMSDLNDAMFEDDKNQNINTFRQNLQATYVSRLIQIITGSSSSRYIIPVKSMAIYNLEKIMKILKNKNGNTSTVAHKNHLRKLISNALDKV